MTYDTVLTSDASSVVLDISDLINVRPGNVFYKRLGTRFWGKKMGSKSIWQYTHKEEKGKEKGERD